MRARSPQAAAGGLSSGGRAGSGHGGLTSLPLLLSCRWVGPRHRSFRRDQSLRQVMPNPGAWLQSPLSPAPLTWAWASPAPGLENFRIPGIQPLSQGRAQEAEGARAWSPGSISTAAPSPRHPPPTPITGLSASLAGLTEAVILPLSMFPRCQAPYIEHEQKARVWTTTLPLTSCVTSAMSLRLFSSVKWVQ